MPPSSTNLFSLILNFCLTGLLSNSSYLPLKPSGNTENSASNSSSPNSSSFPSNTSLPSFIASFCLPGAPDKSEYFPLNPSGSLKNSGSMARYSPPEITKLPSFILSVCFSGIPVKSEYLPVVATVLNSGRFTRLLKSPSKLTGSCIDPPSVREIVFPFMLSCCFSGKSVRSL